MGTRNLICVVKDNEFKLTKYCQWDGYLSGQGKDIINIIIRFNTEGHWGRFRKHVDGLVYISDKEVNNRWKEFDTDNFILDACMQFCDKYPNLHRDTGADILNLILFNKNLEVTKPNPEFAYRVGGLSCEYCYVLDLDDDVLEIYSYYKGNKKGRFRIEDNGIKLFSTIPFKEINQNTIFYLEKAHKKAQ